MKSLFHSVDEYITSLPSERAKLARAMRRIIRDAITGATEGMSYGMPAYRKGTVLVYFAIHPKHVGFYPTPSGIARFSAELANYKTSKGAVQFPLNEPLPEPLIADICKFRMSEVPR